MLKLISTTLAILLLSYQYPECKALVAPFKTLEDAKTIKETSAKLEKLFISDIVTDKGLNHVVAMKDKHIDEEIYDELYIIEKFPRMKQLQSNLGTLHRLFYKIKETFKQAIRTQRRINKGQVSLSNTFYESFEKNNAPFIYKAISEIRKILTNEDIGSYLQESLHEDVKKSEAKCKTGMSHLQTMDTLLRGIRIVSAEYYTSRSLMNSFLELKGQDRKAETKKLLVDEEAEFEKVVQFFRDLVDQATGVLKECPEVTQFEDQFCQQVQCSNLV